jgi:DNA-binding beta-propeller fold protein YncE
VIVSLSIQTPTMRKAIFLSSSLLLALFSFSQNNIAKLEANKVTLPNGWSLTPVGRSFPLGDLPLNIAVSRSKKLMAVTNNGQSVQSIQLIDPSTETILDNKIIPKSWYGLQFSADEKKLYASGGNDNWILEYAIENKKLVLKDSIILGKKWPNKISPSGIAVDDEKEKMYVVSKENNSLYIIDLATKKPNNSFHWAAKRIRVFYRPIKKNCTSAAGVATVFMCLIRKRKM